MVLKLTPMVLTPSFVNEFQVEWQQALNDVVARAFIYLFKNCRTHVILEIQCKQRLRGI